MWFGYGGSAHFAEELRSTIENLGMELITIHEHDNADIKWERTTWLNELRKADIIIIPCNWKEQPAKSNNRLTQAMSLGKPIICSPLPAYKRIIEKYKCALIAFNKDDWYNLLSFLSHNEDARKEYSQKALEASKQFNIDSICEKWLFEFNNLEKVDIIIPTYNNLKYLKLCLDSIRKCTHTLYNIIIVDNSSTDEAQQYLIEQADIIYIRKDRMSFAQAINEGLKVSKSKYVCLLNDDVIVSKGWLSEMLKVAQQENVGAVGPLSNCDKGWLHNIDMKIETETKEGPIKLLPGQNTYSQIEPIVEDIYNYKVTEYDNQRQNWIAYYCALIPKKVINEVGILDENFTNSGEDVDHCYRIKKMGYEIIQARKSFVFHFGAVGRKILENEDKEAYQKANKTTTLYLNEKWNKKNVVIYTGPSFERWDFRSLERGGIGGSETWAIEIAREFSNLGYRVKIFADCSDSGLKDGNYDVEYLHYSQYPSYIEQNWIDYFITSRTTDTLAYNIRSEKNFVMIHDIWLSRNQNYPLHSDKVDKYLCLSTEHKNFVMNHHNIPEDKIEITINGLDIIPQKIEKKRFKCIYSSSPDRGLENLLYLFPFIKEKVPEVELEIFYGFDNLLKIPDKVKWAEALLEKIEETDGVTYHGRVNKIELSKAFAESSILLYPTWFEETFYITGVEAMASGCVVLSSNYWGLKDTIGNAGILIDINDRNEAVSKEYRQKFVDEAIKLLKDDEYFNEFQLKGYEKAKQYSWKNAAKGIEKLFYLPQS